MPHTPGPYHVETREHVHAICCRPTRPGEHKEVAFVDVSACAFPGKPPGDLSAGSITAQQRTAEELAANAQLFAAAPDLLAACKEIAIDPYLIADAYTQRIADRLLDAIAKAEGR